MGLLQPESGLLFWMALAFFAVFAVAARFGFPVIIRSIESRKEYIDSSLGAAREAERRLAEIGEEGRAIVDAAGKERAAILREAAETRERILAEARAKAEEEGAKIVAAARTQADAERREILRDARRQVALLSVAVSERLLRRALDDESAQTALAERMLDEITAAQTDDKPCTPD